MNATNPTPSPGLSSKEAPAEIYLQWHGDSKDTEPVSVPDEGVSWCAHQVFPRDIKYVRADLAETNGKALAAAQNLSGIREKALAEAQKRADIAEAHLAQSQQTLEALREDRDQETTRILALSNQPEIERLKADLQKSQARETSLAAALSDLIFTATKLWDEVKPIKDGPAMRVTHPIIENASEALARHQAAVDPSGITDTQRLDWLEVERPELVAVCDEKDTWYEVREVLELAKLGKGKTLRAAIDAAMKGAE